ncbi:hypothetical protein Pla52n_68510 [Stieleria varia]|uniref:Uncharacterized protein n=2 Tax=Stieleria varia TaxID=2528005 RepID=A0A5C5ZP59_9BACT|nr:hypothetical protein Pla52n_68510 [Stieleria varia]
MAGWPLFVYPDSAMLRRSLAGCRSHSLFGFVAAVPTLLACRYFARRSGWGSRLAEAVCWGISYVAFYGAGSAVLYAKYEIGS